MKTKGNRKSKINIVTLGCSKNLVDSEVLFTQLKGNGLNVSHESAEDDAQIVVINTCFRMLLSFLSHFRQHI